jgi:hypothetical protein
MKKLLSLATLGLFLAAHGVVTIMTVYPQPAAADTSCPSGNCIRNSVTPPDVERSPDGTTKQFIIIAGLALAAATVGTVTVMTQRQPSRGR